MSRTIPLAATAALVAATIACGTQSSAPTAPSATGATGTAAAADGSTLKVTAPAPQAPVNDAQLTDVPTLVASASAPKFGGQIALTYRFEVFNAAGAKVVDSGVVPSPTFRVSQSLELRQRHSWRVRAESSEGVGPWSAAASFVTSEGGYLRGNSAFDPLSNGTTVGQVVGPVTFLPNVGARLESGQSYIRYPLPLTLNAGELSMEVLGLRANAPGDKSKVFSMGSDAPDFLTDPWRIDIQYRGTSGFPANAIQFRVLYGDADDLDVRYEPDTATRVASTVGLNPAQVYFWKFTWGNGEVRLVVREGGAQDNGRPLYNQAVRTPNGTYNPRPHVIYVGAPTGRSFSESASIAGATYRNVYVGPGPRP